MRVAVRRPCRLHGVSFGRPCSPCRSSTSTVQSCELDVSRVRVDRRLRWHTPADCPSGDQAGSKPVGRDAADGLSGRAHHEDDRRCRAPNETRSLAVGRDRALVVVGGRVRREIDRSGAADAKQEQVEVSSRRHSNTARDRPSGEMSGCSSAPGSSVSRLRANSVGCAARFGRAARRRQPHQRDRRRAAPATAPRRGASVRHTRRTIGSRCCTDWQTPQEGSAPRRCRGAADVGSRSRQRAISRRTPRGVSCGSARRSMSARMTAATVSEAVSQANSERPASIS